MTRRYTHLFFDLDHTLWDFEANATQVLREIWAEHGRGADFAPFKASFDHHNERLWTRFRNGTISRGDLRWKRFSAVLLDLRRPNEALAQTMGTAFLEALPKQTGLIPGAREVLKHCADRGYELHLITNGFETTQWQKLRVASLDAFFGQVFTSEGCGCPKPHRGIFEHARNATSAKDGECLMIGDSLEADICGARDAGWHQAYYNPQRVPHSHRPTFEVAGLEELCKIL